MNLRRSGRRGAVVGAGAATMTAAALFLGPTTAAGAPEDPVDEAAQAVQEAVDEARQAAEDAARAAEDAAEAAEEAADQAEQAVHDAAEEAEQAEDDAETGDPSLDVTQDQVDWLPQDLQDDLQNLQDLPADERADEVEQVLQDAVTGDYGEEVENWSERMVDFMDALPENLQNDLQDVMGMEPDAAHEQLEDVWQGVLDGDYGGETQMWGQWLQQSFQQWNLGEVIQGDMDAGTEMDE